MHERVRVYAHKSIYHECRNGVNLRDVCVCACGRAQVNTYSILSASMALICVMCACAFVRKQVNTYSIMSVHVRLYVNKSIHTLS